MQEDNQKDIIKKAIPRLMDFRHVFHSFDNEYKNGSYRLSNHLAHTIESFKRNASTSSRVDEITGSKQYSFSKIYESSKGNGIAYKELQKLNPKKLSLDILKKSNYIRLVDWGQYEKNYAPNSSITIDAGNGDDCVRIADYNNNFAVNVSLGKGNDRVIIKDDQNASISLGKGKDTIVQQKIRNQRIIVKDFNPKEDALVLGDDVIEARYDKKNKGLMLSPVVLEGRIDLGDDNHILLAGVKSASELNVIGAHLIVDF